MMLKTPLMPKDRSRKLMIFYYIIHTMAWSSLHTFLLPVITSNWPKWLLSYSFWLTILFAVVTALTDPGWLGNNKAKPVIGENKFSTYE